MISRAAFFADKKDFEEQLSIQIKSDVLLDPNYNITPGEYVPTLVKMDSENGLKPKKIRWGAGGNKNDDRTTLEKEKVWDLIKNKKTNPCLILLSGFYVWKKERENEHPFFVRMLNNPIMTIAGYITGEDEYCSMVITDSNPLIHPMSEKMPIVLNSKATEDWLQLNGNPTKFLTEYKDPLLLTDFSVLRVSKKVNDPKNNDPKLIQPIPK
tara:strand:- start:213 stop:845 length:633 start_codon:yes stop_codon:yes gene_type:complete